MRNNTFYNNPVIGESDSFLNLQQAISKVAKVNRPVLLVGERGTGKELAAARLHFLSKRWQEPYITVNCAALPSSLLESELFGHESGSFTGAKEARKGRFEEAHGGTLFLDEIGLIPMEVQEKILRTVEYGTFARVGSSKEKEVDVRIVAATNANLVKLCQEGQFKEDLLDRLSFEVLFLPPLRYRQEDIPLLIQHFSQQMTRELDLDRIPQFSPTLLKQMLEYPWPGNIRELKNVTERAIYKAKSSFIENISLEPFKNPYESLNIKENKTLSHFNKPPLLEEEKTLNFKDLVENFEISLLEKSLSRSQGHQKEAALLLGLSYNQFRGLYRKYKLRLKTDLT